MWTSASESGGPPVDESRPKDTSLGRGLERACEVSSLDREAGDDDDEEAGSSRPRVGGDDMMWQSACRGHAMEIPGQATTWSGLSSVP